MNKSIKTKDIVLTALFTALIAVGAFIKIPVPYVPITMQTFFVMMAGIMLGPKYGSISAILYMAIGLIGIPIFTQGGGFGYVFVPSFGYIIGFIVGVFIIGIISKKKEGISFKWNLFSNIIGIFVIYIFGIVYFYIIMKYHYSIEKDAIYILKNLFLLFVPCDFIMAILAAYISVKINRYLINK